MMSMLKKIALFPISLFVAFLALMAKWLLTLSSYVVAPLMLYIFGCGIYTAYRQTWNQFFILLVAEFICFILFFGATVVRERQHDTNTDELYHHNFRNWFIK